MGNESAKRSVAILPYARSASSNPALRGASAAVGSFLLFLL
jgi:hypothetical protein